MVLIMVIYIITYDAEYAKIDDDIQACINKIQQLKDSLIYYQN